MCKLNPRPANVSRANNGRLVEVIIGVNSKIALQMKNRQEKTLGVVK